MPRERLNFRRSALLLSFCENRLCLSQLIERFSKPNFGSIRRFRTVTGLEIENWIEKRGRTVRKFRSTRPRTESNFRFGLTSCRSQNLPSEVRSLLCQIFDSVSLITSSTSHHASHLRGFIRSLTSFHSTRLMMSFFYIGRRFSAGTWSSSVNEWARGVDHGITSDRGLGRRSPPGLAQFDKEHFFGTQGPRFSTARHQSSSAGHAIVWSILFAERNFRLCVNRNFDTIFDPVLPEPNRIFGLLNLSNKKVKFDGARCPFSTFLRLQGDHHCACGQKWRHFSFFPRAFKQKKLRLYDQRWLK